MNEELSNYLDVVNEGFIITNTNLIEEKIKLSLDYFQKKFHLDIFTELNPYYINFNYTNTLEKILETTPYYYNFLHIHGDLKSNTILGVNDLNDKTPKQKLDGLASPFIPHEYYELNRWLIKHNLIPQDRIERAEEILKNSSIICIYGMSIGESDEIWWKNIALWLSKNEENQLIIFHHNENNLKKSVRQEIAIIFLEHT